MNALYAKVQAGNGLCEHCAEKALVVFVGPIDMFLCLACLNDWDGKIELAQVDEETVVFCGCPKHKKGS